MILAAPFQLRLFCDSKAEVTWYYNSELEIQGKQTNPT